MYYTSPSFTYSNTASQPSFTPEPPPPPPHSPDDFGSQHHSHNYNTSTHGGQPNLQRDAHSNSTNSFSFPRKRNGSRSSSFLLFAGENGSVNNHSNNNNNNNNNNSLHNDNMSKLETERDAGSLCRPPSRDYARGEEIMKDYNNPISSHSPPSLHLFMGASGGGGEAAGTAPTASATAAAGAAAPFSVDSSTTAVRVSSKGTQGHTSLRLGQEGVAGGGSTFAFGMQQRPHRPIGSAPPSLQPAARSVRASSPLRSTEGTAKGGKTGNGATRSYFQGLQTLYSRTSNALPSGGGAGKTTAAAAAAAAAARVPRVASAPSAGGRPGSSAGAGPKKIFLRRTLKKTEGGPSVPEHATRPSSAQPMRSTPRSASASGTSPSSYAAMPPTSRPVPSSGSVFPRGSSPHVAAAAVPMMTSPTLDAAEKEQSGSCNTFIDDDAAHAQEAHALREKGNTYFAKQRYYKAIQVYTKALECIERQLACQDRAETRTAAYIHAVNLLVLTMCNRAAAYLFVCQFFNASLDCQFVLRCANYFDSATYEDSINTYQFLKARWRLAKCFFLLENIPRATEEYKTTLQLYESSIARHTAAAPAQRTSLESGSQAPEVSFGKDASVPLLKLIREKKALEEEMRCVSICAASFAQFQKAVATRLPSSAPHKDRKAMAMEVEAASGKLNAVLQYFDKASYPSLYAKQLEMDVLVKPMTVLDSIRTLKKAWEAEGENGKGPLRHRLDALYAECLFFCAFDPNSTADSLALLRSFVSNVIQKEEQEVEQQLQLFTLLESALLLDRAEDARSREAFVSYGAHVRTLLQAKQYTYKEGAANHSLRQREEKEGGRLSSIYDKIVPLQYFVEQFIRNRDGGNAAFQKGNFSKAYFYYTNIVHLSFPATKSPGASSAAEAHPYDYFIYHNYNLLSVTYGNRAAVLMQMNGPHNAAPSIATATNYYSQALEDINSAIDLFDWIHQVSDSGSKEEIKMNIKQNYVKLVCRRARVYMYLAANGTNPTDVRNFDNAIQDFRAANYFVPSEETRAQLQNAEAEKRRFQTRPRPRSGAANHTNSSNGQNVGGGGAGQPGGYSYNPSSRRRAPNYTNWDDDGEDGSRTSDSYADNPYMHYNYNAKHSKVGAYLRLFNLTTSPLEVQRGSGQSGKEGKLLFNKTNLEKAYRKAALQWHPDRWVGNASVEEQKQAEAKFKEITAAYEALRDIGA